MKKNIILTVLILILLCSNIAFADTVVDEPIISFEKGRVLNVEDKHMEGDYSYDYQQVKLKILTGKYEGEIVNIENALTDNSLYNIVVKEKDKVLLAIEEFEESKNVHITDYARDSVVKLLVIAFLLLLIFVGRGKGFKSVITISLTVLLIFGMFLPLVLKGFNPLFLTIIISTIITLITIILVSGLNKKSYAAIIGTISGVVIAGIISIIIAKLVKLTGMSMEEAGMLMNIPQEITFDFRNLLFAGIILGALGAVMDVAMSIASSIQEIHNANNNLSRSELFKSGMEVGRDIMGTMSNTLILAYTGSFIPLLLLFLAYETPFIRLINMDIVATEIVRSIAGSIGLILTIPITAFFAVTFLKKEKQ
ncbi:Uncharacterized membrane protein [Desulfonispora thiosulfatigenes DSM 11270]|uniref:Uncharacterized membrane protein n=1 Tax=Desulfonispora thiosulfatigenes DSM 11270 TaxID=656914 RepID=A0A1W1UEC0_DESTI|nr:YibE/F family protein [Desulfonispora thiosulfatigenes]SMB79389.1 Uncharacterized membrane protein [Desulfonispora thiosulfatigenes DSM 11270]